MALFIGGPLRLIFASLHVFLHPPPAVNWGRARKGRGRGKAATMEGPPFFIARHTHAHTRARARARTHVLELYAGETDGLVKGAKQALSIAASSRFFSPPRRFYRFLIEAEVLSAPFLLLLER